MAVGSAEAASSRLGEPLQGAGSLIGEADPRRREGEAPDRLRHEHLARGGLGGHPRGEVDGAAEDVAPIPDHVARVEADVQAEAGASGGVDAAHGALERRAGRGEDGEQPVAEQLPLDDGAAGLADAGAQ